MRFLGVDMGTSGCKAVIFDEDWDIICQAYREYPTYFPGEGLMEIEPALVWENIRAVIREANAKADEPVTALAVSAIGDVIIPVDKDGNCHRKYAIIDFDPRGEDEITKFAETFGREKFFQISGMPPLFIGSLAKILWIRENEPDIFANTARWATFEDYIIQKMGLDPIASYSELSRTMLFDIRKRKWSEEICSAVPITPDQLPIAAESGTVAGTLSPEMCEDLGFPQPVLVAVGGHDMVCAAIGAGLDENEPGTAVDIAGTIEGVVVALKECNTSMEMCDQAFSCYVGYKDYVTFSVNLTAGCITRWYRDMIVPDDYRMCKEEGINFYEYMQRTMKEDEPGSVYLLPHFSGSGNPFFDANAKGALYGLTTDTQRADIGRALVEGLAYEVKMQLDAFEKAGIRIDTLRAVGGGAAIDRQLQLKANITGKKIIKCSVTEGSAMGAAVYAAIAAGAMEHPGEIKNYAAGKEKVFVPDEQSTKKFEKAYETYRKLAYGIHDIEQ
ncbi:MAG: FGGY family carbohydrate kinase [Blautia sp.]|nr:FGGY family carbohydrate kinase [Blautia sp.]MDY5030359.1 FGGY-family carbohydrate kinase [Blautia sp.]